MKVSWKPLIAGIIGVAMTASFFPQTAAAASALCDFSELPSQLGAVVEPAFKCQTASGYSFVQPSTLPTAAELTAICASCSTLLTAVANAKAALPTCALAMDDGSAVTIDKLLTGVVRQCTAGAANGGSTSGGGGTGSSSSSDASPSAGVIPTTTPTEGPTTNSSATTAPTPPKPKKTLAKATIAPSTSRGDTGSETSSGSDEAETTGSRTASQLGPTEQEPIPPALTSVPPTTPQTPQPTASKPALASSSTNPPNVGVLSMLAVTCFVVWNGL